MTLSIPGLIGAAFGLMAALGAYLAIMPLLAREGADTGASTAKPNADAIRAILLADFLVLAAVGYYVGQMFD